MGIDEVGIDKVGIDEVGINPRDKGLLLILFTSCRPGEIAATPCLSVQTVSNDKR